MNIFILEDDPLRMKLFKQTLIGHNVDHADNVTDGKKLLTENEYDLILLDHDLGGEQMVNSADENTGYQLAKFIRDDNISARVIVHSYNPAGAKNILAVLPRAAYIPFSTLIDKLEQSGV